jgi:hypothetical protein
MSSQGNGQDQPFLVTMSAMVRAVVCQLHEQEGQAGRGEAFLAALRQIIHRLRHDPLVFGEPLYRLPSLHLAIRQAIIAPLVVDYAVHEAQRLIIIRGFTTLA